MRGSNGRAPPDFRSLCTAFSTELWELLQILTVASTVQFGLDRKSDGAGSLVNDHDCRDHGVCRRNPLRTVGGLRRKCGKGMDQKRADRRSGAELTLVVASAPQEAARLVESQSARNHQGSKTAPQRLTVAARATRRSSDVKRVGNHLYFDCDSDIPAGCSIRKAPMSRRAALAMPQIVGYNPSGVIQYNGTAAITVSTSGQCGNHTPI